MTTPSSPRSGKKKVLYTLIFLGIVMILLMAIGEGGARIMGYHPWQPEPRNTSVDPEGGFFEQHDRYGYAMKQGKYTLTLNESFSFKARHNQLGMRVCGSKLTRNFARGKPMIWIFGGSFTYGWGVTDEEAFPSLVQDRMPEYHVLNLGVGGYGTLQNYYQFLDLLEEEQKPEKVILAYASFHDQRNTCNRYWMKAIAPQSVLEGLAFPWARIDKRDSLLFGMAPVEYDPYPGMGSSAFVHALEQFRCEGDEHSLNSPEVSYRLINRFQAQCMQDSIQFILAGIEPDGGTQAMLERCGQAAADSAKPKSPGPGA